jgi:hypothetical protein
MRLPFTLQEISRYGSIVAFGRLAVFLLTPVLVSACAVLQGFGVSKAIGGGHVVSVNDELWNISFRSDSSVVDDSQVVTGEVIVRKRGQVVQSIPHTLSRTAAKGDDERWLLIEDVNNDGLPDMLLTHAPAASESAPVKSLFLFDAQSQSFQLQKQVSKLGDIDKTGGCVVVRAQSKDSTNRTYCFTGEQSGWMESKRFSGTASARCNSQHQKVAECRSLRAQRDGEMRQLINSYIDTKSKSMTEEKRQAAALRFARNLRVGHEQWLLYRDARCASYVIEYNFPPSTSGFELESCKLDLSGLQLQHYSSMLSMLDK